MYRIFIIHPLDPSTNFATSITQKLVSQYGDRINSYRPGELSDVNDVFRFITNSTSNDLILFIGHGNSSSLFGASSPSAQRATFLSMDQLRAISRGKKVMLFSCDSRDIMKQIGNDLQKYIGFGNMPTDWNDVLGQRESESNYLRSLTQESIVYYCDLLVEIIYSICDKFITDNGSFRSGYLTSRLLMNSKLYEVEQGVLGIDEKRELYRLIKDTKDEIVIKD